MLSAQGDLHSIWVRVSPVLLELQLPLLEREGSLMGGTLTSVTGISQLLRCSLLALFGNSFSLLTYSLGIGTADGPVSQST